MGEDLFHGHLKLIIRTFKFRIACICITHESPYKIPGNFLVPMEIFEEK